MGVLNFRIGNYEKLASSSVRMFRLAACRQFQTFSRWALIRSTTTPAAAAEPSCSEQREVDPSRPSGWSPPTGTPATPDDTAAVLPFRVARSKPGNLPIYLDYKQGKKRVITHIRKIEGDIIAMEKMLRQHLNEKDLLTRVDDVCGYIKLHGDYKDRVKLWLKSLGF